MNWKNFSITFLLANCIFFGVNNFANAQSLGFYSQIDDTGDTMANQLVNRHLQDFSSFRDFGKNCRGEYPWLDSKPMDQKILDDLEKGDFGSLLALKDPEINISTEHIQELASCLQDTYKSLKNRSIREQSTIEESANIGIYFDGNTKNSDFDIVTDINKINAIIFSNPAKYEGTINNTQSSLSDFLKGKSAPKLWENDEKNTTSHTENNSENSQNTTNNTTNNTNTETKIEENLPWSKICTPDGEKFASVTNMVTDDFIRDLNSTLVGGNKTSIWQDYSENFYKKNSENNNNNSSNNNENTNSEKSDFASKLPCNGIFCITIGSNIGTQNLLTGGKWGNSIEDILNKHIEKTEEISWSDLSGQKMTNNSFQLPFLNVKFKDKVAGGGVFIHNSPQITKTDPVTPEKKSATFDEMYRCAMIESWLFIDENKNTGLVGAALTPRMSATTENTRNSPIFTDPQDSAQINGNANCKNILEEQIRKKFDEKFSTEINEISAFTSAMLDIINQNIETETKLDNIPTR